MRKHITTSKRIVLTIVLAGMLMMSGCNNSETKVSPAPQATNEVTAEKTNEAKATPATQDKENKKIVADNVVSDAVAIGINNENKFQTIEGFGAGFTYYSNYVYFAQYKDEIYDLLFKDANLTILRFKNAYKYDEEAKKEYDTKVEREFYEKAKERLEPDGLSPIVLMSSWTPAQYLKDSESLYGIGTLAKNEKGEFMYDELGQYWADLVQYYRDNGVPIDFISIQNEPDYVAAYESCTFDFVEKKDAASYAKSFLAVYNALKGIDNPPKMLGPETMTCEKSKISLLVNDIIASEPEALAGIAHHLYVGGDEESARSFNTNLRALAMEYPDLRKWMTEYYRGDFMFTVQMIQNSLSIENLNAYIFWGGVWKGAYDKEFENMIGMDAGSNEDEWSHEHGYTVSEKYYAMKHFSEYILPGYVRVDAVVDTTTINEADNDDVSSDDISCSAYVSPENDKMVIVAINDLDKAKKYQFATKSFDFGNSKVILTDYSKGEDTEVYYTDAGKLDEDGCFELPAHSIVTIVVDKE